MNTATPPAGPPWPGEDGPRRAQAGAEHLYRPDGLSYQCRVSGADRAPADAVPVCLHVECAGKAWASVPALIAEHNGAAGVHFYALWSPSQRSLSQAGQPPATR